MIDLLKQFAIATAIVTAVVYWMLPPEVEAQRVQRVPIKIVAATGPDGFDCNQSYDIADAIAADFKASFNIILQYKNKRRCVVNPFAYTVSQYYTANHLAYWHERFNKRKRRLLVLTNPMHEDGKLYFGGVTLYRWRYIDNEITAMHTAVAAIGPKNQSGVDRFNVSVVAASHETAHALGATHDDGSENKMHSAALAFVDANPSIGWSDTTREELKRVER